MRDTLEPWLKFLRGHRGAQTAVMAGMVLAMTLLAVHENNLAQLTDQGGLSRSVDCMSAPGGCGTTWVGGGGQPKCDVNVCRLTCNPGEIAVCTGPGENECKCFTEPPPPSEDCTNCPACPSGGTKTCMGGACGCTPGGPGGAGPGGPPPVGACTTDVDCRVMPYVQCKVAYCTSTGTCDYHVSNQAGTSCNDNNAITENDRCKADGTCEGTVPEPCPGGVCLPPGSCSNDGECNGKVCNKGTCNANHECNYTPDDSIVPPGGSFCTGKKRCFMGTVLTGSPMGGVSCLPDYSLNPCLDPPRCVESTESCEFPKKGDGTACTIPKINKPGTCQKGACVGGNPTCPDGGGGVCHESKGTYNPATATCEYKVTPGADCTLPNSSNKCQVGKCVNTDDNNASCVPTPIVCTGFPANPSCQKKVCVADAGVCKDVVRDDLTPAQQSACLNDCKDGDKVCDDGNPCTKDVCDNKWYGTDKCTHENNSGVQPGCNGGDACSGKFSCQSGSCVKGDGVVCPVPAACHTQGLCQNGVCPAQVPVPDGAPCDDGIPKTTNDRCIGGTCSGIGRDCEDYDACTNDFRNSAGDCEHTLRPYCRRCGGVFGTNCDDGNKCTTDACADKECVNTDILGCVRKSCTPKGGECDDKNACTFDICNDGDCSNYLNPACTSAPVRKDASFQVPPQAPAAPLQFLPSGIPVPAFTPKQIPAAAPVVNIAPIMPAGMAPVQLLPDGTPLQFLPSGIPIPFFIPKQLPPAAIVNAVPAQEAEHPSAPVDASPPSPISNPTPLPILQNPFTPSTLPACEAGAVEICHLQERQCINDEQKMERFRCL